MITKVKIEIFKSYGFDVDAFQHGKKIDKKNMDDDEFFLLNNLIQDFKIITNHQASEQFQKAAEKKLRAVCDNEDTVAEFKKLVYLDSKSKY